MRTGAETTTNFQLKALFTLFLSRYSSISVPHLMTYMSAIRPVPPRDLVGTVRSSCCQSVVLLLGNLYRGGVGVVFLDLSGEGGDGKK